MVAGYGGVEALRGVDLTVSPGEIVVVMGRNGSGKTTLLKSLVGLVKPWRGEVRVDGASIAGRDTADICRTVAYLPQDPNTLLFADTVAEELEITLRNHGMDEFAERTQRRMRMRCCGGWVWSDYAQSYPRDLSVGERQRVALAAVTVTGPRALLLDEPTRGLDYAAKRSLVDLLREWRADGMAILVVTHDVELAAELADRVVMLSQGEVIAEGAPAEVLGASPLFAPQVAKLFPESGWLTVEDVLGAVSKPWASLCTEGKWLAGQARDWDGESS